MMKKSCSLIFTLAAGLSFSHAQNLLHYWNFNNASSEASLLAPTTDLIGGASITHNPNNPAPSSAIDLSATGNNFATLNAQNNDPALTHLRFNEPLYGNLVFSLPTTGHKDIVVKYATLRSGQGAHFQVVHYSVNGTDFIPFDTIAPATGTPTLQTFDFSSVAAVNNNHQFKIKLSFLQGGGGVAGNNRIDNFTVHGNFFGTDVTAPLASFNPATNATEVLTNVHPTITFNEDVRLVSDEPLNNINVDTLLRLTLGSLTGDKVSFNASVSGRTITIVPTHELINEQTYFLVIKAGRIEDLSNNVIENEVITNLKTIPKQTFFQKGDLLPVAYRMNATGAGDEIALLTFVDILPGTKINFTDSKYTDNVPAQCAGGIVWTAPVQGIAAGSVFTIQTDAATTSAGTISGGGFGLSSGGDQVIIYTGTAEAPNFITALSSNQWLDANTACSGSLSKLPAGLNSTSSVSTASSPGNISGNAVNAYYNGSQTGLVSELKERITNPANWIAVAGGTAPQTWPVWSFMGPPVITSAKTLNQRSIRLIFNKAMNEETASEYSHYSGIAGLDSVFVTQNGLQADTVILFYNTDFVQGSSYTLNVSGLRDLNNKYMTETYTYNFNFITKISFATRYTSVVEGALQQEIEINVENPSDFQWTAEIVSAAGTANNTTDTDLVAISIVEKNDDDKRYLYFSVKDDTKEEQDEYFVVKLKAISNAVVSGSPYFTVYIRDNDRKAPVPTKEIELSFKSRYQVANPGEAAGLAEIVAYDAVTKRLFTISTGLKKFDIVDFSDPAAPVTFKQVDVSAYGGGITSVAIMNGVVVIAVPGITSEQDSGSVLFYNTDGIFQKSVKVGALPDMITFTPDGKYILTANEGQPNDAYTIDPEASVSMIDISAGLGSVNQSKVSTLDFRSFNSSEENLLAAGIRKLKVSSTLSQDFEPEYITISPDSRKAWISLQENNAIAELDIETKKITSIWPLGTKDHSSVGNGLDVSDRNNFIHLANWPVKGYYMPDAIANYTVNGTTYLVGANEGDDKEYAGLTERAEVKSLKLDSLAFPEQAFLKEDHNLGRFRVTKLHGDTDNDGDFDILYTIGARSFSIWNAETKEVTFDSGDDFEMITASDTSTSSIFNANNEDNGFKGRSRSKGPEPEGITLAKIGSETFAFVTLERIGGVMVYNISDPANPVFVDYKNTRTKAVFGGDNGPEGIIFIPSATSPDGKTYVVSANEVSGTLSVFEVLKADIITGLDKEEAKSAENIVMRPNPAKDGWVYFNQTVDAEIFDLDGKRLVSSFKVNSLNISQLNKGIYMIRLNSAETRKLVVE